MLVQVGKRYVSEQREIDTLFSKSMRELLSQSKVFKDCHPDFLRDLIASCNRKEYQPNRYLMEEGARGDSMFVLFKGVVEVRSNGCYICKLRNGSIIGEAALLTLDNRRTASVRSVTKCDVAIVFRSMFHSILEKHPWEKRKFRREMTSKMSDLGLFFEVREDVNMEQQAMQCDALRKVPIFAEDETLHSFVSELSMNATSSWFKPGKVILREGDTKCDDMYVLMTGAAQITACGVHLGRLENDLFGEICFLDLFERRTATVTALTPCHCMVFARQVVIPILAKYPAARSKLMTRARNRLLALNLAIGASVDGYEQGTHEGCAIGYGTKVGSEDSNMFASSRFFADADNEFLCELASQMSTEAPDDGAVLMQEDDPYSAGRGYVYWIRDGEAEVWRRGCFVTKLRNGDYFGELAIFHPGKRRITVKATRNLVVRAVPCYMFDKILREHGGDNLVAKLKAEAERRIRELDGKDHKVNLASLQPVAIDYMFLKTHPHEDTGLHCITDEPASWIARAADVALHEIQCRTPRTLRAPMALQDGNITHAKTAPLLRLPGSSTGDT